MTYVKPFCTFSIAESHIGNPKYILKLPYLVTGNVIRLPERVSSENEQRLALEGSSAATALGGSSYDLQFVDISSLQSPAHRICRSRAENGALLCACAVPPHVLANRCGWPSQPSSRIEAAASCARTSIIISRLYRKMH